VALRAGRRDRGHAGAGERGGLRTRRLPLRGPDRAGEPVRDAGPGPSELPPRCDDRGRRPALLEARSRRPRAGNARSRGEGRPGGRFEVDGDTACKGRTWGTRVAARGRPCVEAPVHGGGTLSLSSSVDNPRGVPSSGSARLPGSFARALRARRLGRPYPVSRDPRERKQTTTGRRAGRRAHAPDRLRPGVGQPARPNLDTRARGLRGRCAGS
jgi:hypothetical protein